MSEELKCCMDCKNFRTKKIYTRDDSYRVGYCPVFGKDMKCDKELKVYNDANTCYGYIDDGLIHD